MRWKEMRPALMIVVAAALRSDSASTEPADRTHHRDPVGRVTPSHNTQAVALDDAQAKLARLAAQTKGTPQHRLLQEQQRIQGLIDDIQSGRTVDPATIDQTLGDAERSGAW